MIIIGVDDGDMETQQIKIIKWRQNKKYCGSTSMFFFYKIQKI
jgi:hypothetical protein